MYNEVANVQKKENMIIRIFSIIAIAVIVFSIYFFLVSPITIGEDPVNEFIENGALFYTLNLANPISIISNIDPTTSVMIISLLIVIILMIIIILVYSKIRKLKKINMEQKNIDKYINLIDQQEATQPLQKIYLNNNKLLELLDEGNRLIDKKEYADARILHHKIRRLYNSRDDKSKEIYLKIIRFYERIVREEI